MCATPCPGFESFRIKKIIVNEKVKRILLEGFKSSLVGQIKMLIMFIEENLTIRHF
jgi:hypothetical protein